MAPTTTSKDIYIDDILNDIQDAFIPVVDENDPEIKELEKEFAEEVEEVEVEEVVEEVIVKRKKPKNYINNADLMVQLAISREKDQMTNELVKMLTMLCDRYGAKGSFSNYSYLEDMKAYAMYMIVRTWRAFNPEKGNNPFAFFTQCIKNSFIQYLKRERHERDIRDELLVANGLNPSYAYSDSDGGDSNDSYD